MSSSDNGNSGADFGANEWLVAEMYAKWQENPDSVDKSWIPILERYQLSGGSTVASANKEESDPTTGSITVIDTDSTVVSKFDPAAPAPATEAITVPVAKTIDDAPATAPVPADLPATGSIPMITRRKPHFFL